MPNYYPGVQTAIPLRVYASDGTPYTTTGTPPTLQVRKNRTGAPATATGTLTHAGSGIWDYTPASGEVSAPCTFLMLTWSGSGIAQGHEAIEFETDYSSTVAGRIDATISSRSSLAVADIRTAVGLASANLDAQLSTIAGYLDTEVATILAAVDTEVAAIKAKTDNLPTDPADASDIAASFASITTLLNTLSGYVDTEVAAILSAVDTEVAAIKAKTDNLPASPAATGDAMTLADGAITAAKIASDAITAAKIATGAIDADALAADAVAEIASGISASSSVYGVQAIRTRIGGTEDDYIALVKSDDKSVVILFEDESHNPVVIPSSATAALLDSGGTSVGTATVTTLTAAAGYVLLRLQAPSSGNLPTVLRITFTGGSGAAYKHDIPVRSYS